MQQPDAEKNSASPDLSNIVVMLDGHDLAPDSSPTRFAEASGSDDVVDDVQVSAESTVFENMVRSHLWTVACDQHQ